jgi:hypothetical protein
LGVSSACADLEFSIFVAVPDVFFGLDFLFVFFGFGVGVWWRFVFGVGDFFGLGVDAERVSLSSD